MDLSRQFAHFSWHWVKLFLHKLNCLDSVQIRLDSKQFVLLLTCSRFSDHLSQYCYILSRHMLDCWDSARVVLDNELIFVNMLWIVSDCLHLSQKYFGLSWKFAVLSRLFVKLSRQFADLSWHMMDCLDCVQISFDSVRLSRHIQGCLKIVRI